MYIYIAYFVIHTLNFDFSPCLKGYFSPAIRLMILMPHTYFFLNFKQQRYRIFKLL